jgi:hypothetical protein
VQAGNTGDRELLWWCGLDGGSSLDFDDCFMDGVSHIIYVLGG